MLPRVTSVRHLRDHQLQVEFSDGTVAELDFHQQIAGRGGVFRPLQSVEFFAQVAVDPEAGTLSWPNGVDLCPNVLYSQATGKPIAEAGSVLPAG